MEDAKGRTGGSRGTPSATSADIERAHALTAQLFDRAQDQATSLQELSRRSSVAVGTLSQWRAGKALPRSGHLAAAGEHVGLRLEWAPGDPGWPGVDLPHRQNGPEAESWWGGNSSRGAKQTGWQKTDLFVVYTLALLGAELRWWRTESAELPLDRVPSLGARSWLNVETGPTLMPVTGAFVPRMRSAPLLSVIAAGDAANLDLVWMRTDDQWRVRPWQVTVPAG